MTRIATSNATTEAAAIAAIAAEAAQPRELSDGNLYLLGSGEQIDTDHRLSNPRRPKGTATLFTGAALSTYVKRFQGNDTLLYADRERFEVVAVLNDSTADVAGWGDFRGVLKVRHTKAWQHWASQDGKLLGQVEFAEHIEGGLREIVTPEAAAMLEVAQSFELHRTVAFRSGSRLSSGERQLVYVETDESAKTKQGTIEFPERIFLRIEPFEGSAPYGIEARLRYRITDGRLAMGYTLDRPHDLLGGAFDEFVAAIEEATAVTALIGSPASAR